MTENYLHFLWKNKRLPFHLIKTTCDQEIVVRNVGLHNTNESGPDFSNGKIYLDGLEWCGNIELHIKSSDWYAHRHQFDSAYQNVILHVVYEHDCDIQIQNSTIPTIELKKHIDWNHFENFNLLTTGKDEINCSKSITMIDLIYIESMIERALFDRLNRKSFLYSRQKDLFDPKEHLYFLSAKAFGIKVNQLPFEELAHRLPLSSIKKFNKQKQFEMIINVSGIRRDEHSFIEVSYISDTNKVMHHSWKRKGLRPASFPEIRIHQFALFVSRFDFELLHFTKCAKGLYEFIHELFSSISKENSLKYKFTEQIINLIIINCIVPFLWWLADFKEDHCLKENALDLLKLIKPENNSITLEWRKYGISIKSAYESQGLIELYNEYCSKNKCLSCEIGVNVLKF